MNTHRIIRLAPEHERALESVCVHEAGHEIVACYYNLAAETHVFGLSAGICLHSVGTPKQVAAVAWAGVLAEDLIDVRNKDRTLPKVSLSRYTLSEWFGEMERDGWAQMSPQDRLAVQAFPAQSSCESGFVILSARRELLRFHATLLAAESRERVSASIVRGSSAADDFDVELFFQDDRQARQRANVAELLARLADVGGAENKSET